MGAMAWLKRNLWSRHHSAHLVGRSVGVVVDPRWLLLFRARFLVCKQATKQIAFDAQRLPPPRGNVQSAGRPELID
jgi:hypothetical protein